MNKIKIIGFTFLSLISCTSTFKIHKSDYYQVINQVLLKSLESQDSIFLPLPYTDKEFKKRKKEKRIHSTFIDFEFSESASNIVKDFLKKEANINFKDEIQYFKKQMKHYEVLDTSKILVKKIKYFPRPKNLKDTIKYMDYKYVKYSFGGSKPVFTKNGEYALISYYGKGGGYYILLYQKVNFKWKEKARILYLRT